MENKQAIFEFWKLSLATVVVAVLLIDIHSFSRNLSVSAERVADSYVKQSSDVSDSAQQMASILFPPESRNEYRQLAVEAHRVFLQQMRTSLKQYEREQGVYPPAR
jgi:hypothetical protein